MSFRVLFTIATFYNLDINQIEVKKSFLYNFINQFIYINFFKGIKLKLNQNIIYKLFKILYSFKQSSHFWYIIFSTFFLEKLSLK